MKVITPELDNNLNIGINLPSNGGTLGATASGKVSLSVASATFTGGQSTLTGIAKDSSAGVMGAPEVSVSLTVTFGFIASTSLQLGGSALMSDKTIDISED
jgi:hypothetical protein